MSDLLNEGDLYVITEAVKKFHYLDLVSFDLDGTKRN